MKWSKIGKMGLFILGLIPYVGLSFLVVIMWDKYIGLPSLIEDIGELWKFGYLEKVLSAQNVFCGLSLLGSWAFWYLFCKLLKCFWWAEI